MDKFKSMLLEGFLKKKFSQYLTDGDISADIDTEKCCCIFKATLAGEPSPIILSINKFEVVGIGADKFLRITDVHCDRQWLNIALNDFLKNKDLKLPPLVASAL